MIVYFWSQNFFRRLHGDFLHSESWFVTLRELNTRYREVDRSWRHGRLARWRRWRACDLGEAKEWLENGLWPRWRDGRVGEWAVDVDEATVADLILQPFRRFTYVTAHSQTLPSLYLRHSSISNSSIALPTSQLILQPFFRFSYVTDSSLTLPGEPPMHISYVNYKIFAKYCGRHWQKQGSDRLSQVQFFVSFYCQIPPS